MGDLQADTRLWAVRTGQTGIIHVGYFWALFLRSPSIQWIYPACGPIALPKVRQIRSFCCDNLLARRVMRTVLYV